MTDGADGDPNEAGESEDGSAPDVGYDTANLMALTPTYQALVSRYLALITTRWQTFALGLTAQGFVIGAASQIQESHLPTAVLLAIVILFIGLATIVAAQRFELLALADRYLLDAYEVRILQGQNADLRLHHRAPTSSRSVEMLQGDALLRYQSESRQGLLNRLAGLGATKWWAYTQIVISVAGAAIPLLRYFGL